MAGELKAIETRYDGRLFRSRLEARWAVFFNTAGIEYQYEPEGFDLDGLWYLPDFWLPKQEYWIEIKPYAPSVKESACAERLTMASHHSVGIFFGDIPWPHSSGFMSPDDSAYWHEAMLIQEEPNSTPVWIATWDNYHCWCQCSRCGWLSVQFDGRSERSPCGCLNRSDEEYTAQAPSLMRAYTAARQARFERR